MGAPHPPHAKGQHNHVQYGVIKYQTKIRPISLSMGESKTISARIMTSDLALGFVLALLANICKKKVSSVLFYEAFGSATLKIVHFVSVSRN